MSFLKKAASIASTGIIGATLVACGSSDSTSGIRFADLNNEGGPRVNYQAVGSGSGRKAFIDETVDFGASDDPMKATDIAKVKRGLVQIPMVGGTIAFGYNNPDCELKLTQRQAVRIAMGKINNWSELGCPDQKLTWAHRSDGSGTTKAFTNSMEEQALVEKVMQELLVLLERHLAQLGMLTSRISKTV